jgi:hypothetical protein
MIKRHVLSTSENRLIVAALLLVILPIGSVYAEFESKPEYKSIIAKDPEIGKVFSDLFIGMNKPQVDRVAEGVFLARGFGQGDISMDSQTFRLFYIGMLSLENGFSEGEITGNKAKAQSFFELFD